LVLLASLLLERVTAIAGVTDVAGVKVVTGFPSMPDVAGALLLQISLLSLLFLLLLSTLLLLGFCCC
jgi:hypothetical protein